MIDRPGSSVMRPTYLAMFALFPTRAMALELCLDVAYQYDLAITVLNGFKELL